MASVVARPFWHQWSGQQRLLVARSQLFLPLPIFLTLSEEYRDTATKSALVQLLVANCDQTVRRGDLHVLIETLTNLRVAERNKVVADLFDITRWDQIEDLTGYTLFRRLIEIAKGNIDLAFRNSISPINIENRMGGAKPTPEVDENGQLWFKHYDTANPNSTKSVPLRAEIHKQICLADTIDHPVYLYCAIHAPFDGKIMPPLYANLEDADVFALMVLCHVRQCLSPATLHRYWPAVFSTIGYPHPSRRQEGRPAIWAAKSDNGEGVQWGYVCIRGVYTLYGGGEFSHLPDAVRTYTTKDAKCYPWQRPKTTVVTQSYRTGESTRQELFSIEPDMTFDPTRIVWPTQVDQKRMTDSMYEYISDTGNQIPWEIRGIVAAERVYERKHLPEVREIGNIKVFSTFNLSYAEPDGLRNPLEAYEVPGDYPEEADAYRQVADEEIDEITSQLVPTQNPASSTSLGKSILSRKKKISSLAFGFEPQSKSPQITPTGSTSFGKRGPGRPKGSKNSNKQTPTEVEPPSNADASSDEWETTNQLPALTQRKAHSGSQVSSTTVPEILAASQQQAANRLKDYKAFTNNNLTMIQLAVGALDRSLVNAWKCRKEFLAAGDQEAAAVQEKLLKSGWQARHALHALAIHNSLFTQAALGCDLKLDESEFSSSLPASADLIMGESAITKAEYHEWRNEMIEMNLQLGELSKEEWSSLPRSFIKSREGRDHIDRYKQAIEEPFVEGPCRQID